MKTGGGPQSKIELTPYEERGLSCWGKVAVTGSNSVQETGGLNLQENNLEYTVLNNETTEEPYTIVEVVAAQDPEENFSEKIQEIIKEACSKPKPRDDTQVFTPHGSNTNVQRRNKVKQSRYDTAAQLLVQSCTSSTNLQQKIIENKYKLEKERLRFEVEKFKYQNPDFKFDLQF